MPENQVTTEAIAEVAASVWEQVLGLPMEVVGSAPPDQDASDLSVCVHITGAWNGAVLFWPSDRFAVKAAAIVFDCAEAEIAAADIQDGMAELGNIVAGNLKSLLPGPSMLSLPTVTRGRQHEVFISRTRLVARLSFACAGELLSVLLLEGARSEGRSVAGAAQRLCAS